MSGKKNIEKKLGALLVIITGVSAYYNSFRAPFIFDDKTSIINNLQIRHLWPLWNFMAGSFRPVTDITFAVNYRLGGFNIWGYHAANLAIHILAALILFGIAHRTLVSESLRDHYGKEAYWIALSIALIWVVHPLQTESVTYIVQRAESLMGLFYLLTLYCLIRGTQSYHKYGWYIGSVASCALGMGTKSVMATAPLAVLLYDRIFLSKSFNEALRKRLWLYLSLAVTLSILVIQFKMLYQYKQVEATVGFGIKETTPLKYILIQPAVILHYLKLVFWPYPLVFDYYYWEVSSWTIKSLALPAIAIIIIGGWNLLSRIVTSGQVRQYMAIVLIGALVMVLGWVTMRRNIDYYSEFSIWSDVVAKRPSNPRGHNNLGLAFFRQGRINEAIAHYKEALRLKPDYAEARNNLAMVLVG